MRKKGVQTNYKERAQPLERAGLGILEKKRDFLVRSRREQEAQRLLRDLKKQVASKNDEEFSFAIYRSYCTNGKIIRRSRGAEAVLLQDAKRSLLALESEEVKCRRRMELLGVGGPCSGSGSRIVFADAGDAEEPEDAGSADRAEGEDACYTEERGQLQRRIEELKAVRENITRELERLAKKGAGESGGLKK